MRILVAESDPALGTFLRQGFGAEYQSVDLAADGDEAMRLVQEREYDAAVLDVNVVRPGGLQVLRDVRSKQPKLPVLLLTTPSRAEGRVQALDLGADDVVLKPFAFSELSARVRALLRRGRQTTEAVLRVEDLELSRVEHAVKRAGREIELTPKEFGLLEFLMQNAGRGVTRAQIVEHVWKLSADTMTNVVDVYINYLRKKVDAKSERKLIHTVRGLGYLLEAKAVPAGGDNVDNGSGNGSGAASDGGGSNGSH